MQRNSSELVIGFGKGRGFTESSRSFNFNNNAVFNQFVNSQIPYLKDHQNKIIFVKARHSDLLWMLQNRHIDAAIGSSVWFRDDDPTIKAHSLLDKVTKPCRLSLISKQPLELKDGLNIATRFLALGHDYFEKKGLKANMIHLSGCHENAIMLNFADAIIDIIETGSTIKRLHLTEIEILQHVNHKVYIRNQGEHDAVFTRLNQYLVTPNA